jgi:aryl-alcohol dehydrogenase-like predicted oxidoreductase
MNYKLLGKSGLRVTELCLGTMTFGTEWGWGADYQASKSIFDAYANAGGNFVDTANRYTEGTSERMVGDFIAADRDHFVLATKYTLQDRKGDPNFAGNHRKNMMRSVEESLKRLKTDFVDLLWVHAWDGTTPLEEMMRGLDDLVTQGKVHYVGISDTPAWVVAQANTLADWRGWSRFVGLQVEYSLIQRSAERDLLPMAKALDLAVTPWAPLAGGALSGKYLKGEKGRVPENSSRINERSTKIAKTVVSIAEDSGTTPTQVALNWLLQKKQVVIPIVGARTASQMEDSLGCLSFKLSDEQITLLNDVSQIELGFPHDFLSSEGVQNLMFSETQRSLHNHRK